MRKKPWYIDHVGHWTIQAYIDIVSTTSPSTVFYRTVFIEPFCIEPFLSNRFSSNRFLSNHFYRTVFIEPFVIEPFSIEPFSSNRFLSNRFSNYSFSTWQDPAHRILRGHASTPLATLGTGCTVLSTPGEPGLGCWRTAQPMPRVGGYRKNQRFRVAVSLELIFGRVWIPSITPGTPR